MVFMCVGGWVCLCVCVYMCEQNKKLNNLHFLIVVFLANNISSQLRSILRCPLQQPRYKYGMYREIQ